MRGSLSPVPDQPRGREIVDPDSVVRLEGVTWKRTPIVQWQVWLKRGVGVILAMVMP